MAKKKVVRKAVAKKAPAKKTGYIKVEYGHPGINSIHSGLVAVGTTHRSALQQLGIDAAETKEGIISKTTGENVGFDEPVKEGLYMLCPGVNSSN
jgi:hypothetical protein